MAYTTLRQIVGSLGHDGTEDGEGAEDGSNELHLDLGMVLCVVAVGLDEKRWLMSEGERHYGCLAGRDLGQHVKDVRLEDVCSW